MSTETKRAKHRQPRSAMGEARPLVQAILLGLVLAAALIVAAAVAKPHSPSKNTVPEVVTDPAYGLPPLPQSR